MEMYFFHFWSDMADSDSSSYVQRRNLVDFLAKYYHALKFFLKIDIPLQNF